MNEGLSLSEFGECCVKLWEEGTLTPKLTAYNDGTGTWTIGFGCIEGVYKGMKITADEAEAMFQKEVDKHVAIVRKYLKRTVEQYEFDALCSFTYNEGYRPTIFAAANGNDYKNAVPKIMLLYNKARNPKTGKLETWSGLVKRRANEIQLWHGVYQDARIPVEPPYQVANNNDLYYAAEPKKTVSKKAVATVASSAATGLTLLAQNMPADPLGTAEKAVSTGQRVQAVAEQSGGLLQWIGGIGHASGIGLSVLLAAVICGGLYWVLGHWLPAKFGSAA
jgi:lysozyme